MRRLLSRGTPCPDSVGFGRLFPGEPAEEWISNWRPEQMPLRLRSLSSNEAEDRWKGQRIAAGCGLATISDQCSKDPVDASGPFEMPCP